MIRFIISKIIIILLITTIFSCKSNPTDSNNLNIRMLPEILYTAEDNNNTYLLMIMGSDGKNHSQIFSVPQGYILNPSFSNDGNTIVFEVYSSSISGIYTIDINGDNLLKVPHTEGINADLPQFLSNNEDILLRTYSAESGYELRIFNIYNGYQKSFSYDGSNLLASPIISQNGNFIFYQHTDGNIHRIDVNNSSDIAITNLEYTAWPQLTNDATKLYFVTRIPSMTFDLFSIDFDGGNLQRMTNLNDLQSVYFRISKDGKKILNLKREPVYGNFWIMNSNGTDRKEIEINFYDKDVYYEFFPDADYVLFKVNDDNHHLYKVNLSNNEYTKLSLEENYDNTFYCFRPQ
jgi:Tol biopolymer transport system component